MSVSVTPDLSTGLFGGVASIDLTLSAPAASIMLNAAAELAVSDVSVTGTHFSLTFALCRISAHLMCLCRGWTVEGPEAHDSSPFALLFVHVLSLAVLSSGAAIAPTRFFVHARSQRLVVQFGTQWLHGLARSA
jgi:hypothetical protein